MKTIDFIQIPPGKLFSAILRGCFSLFIPLGIFIALLVLAGVTPVDFNDKPTYGFTGFLTALIIYCLLIPLGATIWCWLLLTPGFWLYSKYRQLKKSYLTRKQTPV